jgi:hypothetical protein
MRADPTVERPVLRQRGRALMELRRREFRRERQEFGGRIQWEAVFFGWLAAIGLAASLVAMVLGGLVAAGVTSFNEDASSLVDHVTTGGGAIAIAILALAYLTGGYVAARMARFDGWRQGVGIWLLSLLLVLAAAVTAWIAGGDLDPTKSITLPSNPVDEGPLRDGGVAAVAIVALVPLLSAIVGGVLGERFHRAVDRAGILEPEPPGEAEPPPEEAESPPEEPQAEIEAAPAPEAEAETEANAERTETKAPAWP